MIVGKDILELLSTAMYVEPLTLFREYVQNAADAIDDAFDSGVLACRDTGRVDIALDDGLRRVTIRDNGTGLRSADAEQVLVSLGASKKRGSFARGFRGVGRLAGIGFCQKLTFRTKSVEDDQIVVVEWDCRRLREILLDPAYSGDLRSVVSAVVRVETAAAKDPSAHFFEVELDRVLRIRNDVLLNAELISNYLGQVAPVPFSERFQLGSQLSALLDGFVPPPRCRIYVGGAAEPLTKPILDTFTVSRHKKDRFAEIEVLRFPSQDGGLAAVGWVLHHSYSGSLRHAPAIRGMRARLGGIQVGGPDLFAQVFPEPRFSSWTVGEIHILDRRIVPNGRRDDFEHTSSYFHLLNQLTPLGRAIAGRCRSSSVLRARLRTFELVEQKVEELLGVLRRGHTGGQTLKSLLREAADLVEKLRSIANSRMLQPHQRKAIEKRVGRVERQLEAVRKGKRVRVILKSMPKAKREAFAEVFNMIYSCSQNRTTARTLVDKIASHLRAAYE